MLTRVLKFIAVFLVSCLVVGEGLASQAAAETGTETAERHRQFITPNVELEALLVDGALVPGSLVIGRLMKRYAPIHINGQKVKVDTNGYFAFGLPRDASGSVTFEKPDEDLKITLKIAPRVYDVERVDGLPPKTVTPPESWTERRRVETARIGEARSHITKTGFWREGFVPPAEGRYSGFYGSQRVLNGKPRSPHYGLDVANKPGTPVAAPAGGIVRLAAPDFLLEGGIVIIDHGMGVTSTLFHMQKVLVEEGDWVSQSYVIGEMGAAGRASGSHVDWRLNWGDVRLDPGLVVGLPPKLEKVSR